MTDPKPQDDHIEELLSQLQGIFGKLSRQEEEETKDKVEAPNARSTPAIPPTPLTPPPIVPAPAPAPTAAKTPVTPPNLEDPFALKPPMENPAPILTPPSTPPPASIPAPAPTPKPAPAPVTPPPKPADPEPAPAKPVELDSSQLGTGIAFPSGRDADAKTLVSKLEMVTPKFTKVSFRLKVVWTLPYDPKSEWKESLLQQIAASGARAFFLIVDRPLEDARRKALIAELEQRGVYFQEVPLLSIEKKAFYTDVLLGLVFFIDSQKPGGSETPA